MSPEPSTRQHETTIELPASPEEAWKAITDASEVQKWYAAEGAH